MKRVAFELMKVIKHAFNWLEARSVPVLLCILALALVLRLVVFLVFVLPNPSRLTQNVDAKGYERLALNLLHGNGFSASEREPFAPEFLRTPGYPFFVAGVYSLVGVQPVAIALIQILLDIGSVIVVYYIATTTGSRAIALLAAGARALDPSAVALSNSLMSETLFVFLVLLSLLFTHRLFVARNFSFAPAFWLGTVAAGCAIVRPVGMYYGLLIAVFLFIVFWNKVPKPVLMKFSLSYVLIFILMLCPWVIRNYTLTGAFFFTTSSSYNLLFENAVYVESSVVGIDPERIRQEKKETFANLASSKAWNSYQTSLAMRDTALSILLDNWDTSTVLLLKAVGARLLAPHRQEYGILFHGDWRVSGSPGLLYTAGLKDALTRFLRSPGGSLSIFESVFVLALLLFAVAGVIRGVRSELRQVCILNLLVVSYFLFVPGMLLLGRMRFPAMPSISLLSSIGVSRLFLDRSDGQST
jgi:4-amino-4-deoxy-L-arabinose transferase-like glycosyltransferase